MTQTIFILVWSLGIMACLHWQSLYSKMSVILRYYIAFLTCLGQVTEIEMSLSVSSHPRWPRQVRKVFLITFLPLIFANVHEPIKFCFHAVQRDYSRHYLITHQLKSLKEKVLLYWTQFFFGCSRREKEWRNPSQSWIEKSF